MPVTPFKLRLGGTYLLRSGDEVTLRPTHTDPRDTTFWKTHPFTDGISSWTEDGYWNPRSNTGLFAPAEDDIVQEVLPKPQRTIVDLCTYFNVTPFPED